jgi:hypothetical protein
MIPSPFKELQRLKWSDKFYVNVTLTLNYNVLNTVKLIDPLTKQDGSSGWLHTSHGTTTFFATG